LTFLPTELGFMQRILGTTSLVDEMIKVFLRRRRSQTKA